MNEQEFHLFQNTGESYNLPSSTFFTEYALTLSKGVVEEEQ
jgi:hypothetical protein